MNRRAQYILDLKCPWIRNCTNIKDSLAEPTSKTSELQPSNYTWAAWDVQWWGNVLDAMQGSPSSASAIWNCQSLLKRLGDHIHHLSRNCWGMSLALRSRSLRKPTTPSLDWSKRSCASWNIVYLQVQKVTLYASAGLKTCSERLLSTVGLNHHI